MFSGTNASRGTLAIAPRTRSSLMLRGLSCSCTILCRSAANSEVERALLWHAGTTTSPISSSDSAIRLFTINITHQPPTSVATNFFVSFVSFVVNFSAPYAGRTENSGATRADGGYRTSSAFRVPCPGDSNSENLAGSAVRRRAAGRERLLLRCRSSPPHFAGRFRKDRGRDEEGDQSQSSIRENGSVAR